MRKVEKTPKAVFHTPVLEEDEAEQVGLIASGYEWICPLCDQFNKEIEINEQVTCKRCKRVFPVSDYSHCYGHAYGRV
jgi:uncharacterized protein YbaR (Trm112 family)